MKRNTIKLAILFSLICSLALAGSSTPNQAAKSISQFFKKDCCECECKCKDCGVDAVVETVKGSGVYNFVLTRKYCYSGTTLFIEAARQIAKVTNKVRWKSKYVYLWDGQAWWRTKVINCQTFVQLEKNGYFYDGGYFQEQKYYGYVYAMWCHFRWGAYYNGTSGAQCN